MARRRRNFGPPADPCPLIIFDLETGGLDPKVHPVIQFCGAAVNADWTIREELEVKIHFDPRKADAKALETNSFDPDVWTRDAIHPAEAMKRIADLFRRHASIQKISKKSGKPYWVARICGHNSARFDGPFLAEWFKSLEVFCPAACFESLDSLQLARWCWFMAGAPPIENFQLVTLCKVLGIPLVDAHDALADVRATVSLVRQLNAGHQKRSGKAFAERISSQW